MGAYRAGRTDPGFVPDEVGGDWFALYCAVVYLLVAAVLWIGALPDYYGAAAGLTAHGTPTGSLVLGIAAYLSSIALLIGAYLGTTQRATRHDPAPSRRSG